MGTVSGFVAAPCVGPALVVILSVAASAGNALWGALLLFAYAMGFGMLFLVLGSFPSLLGRMPRSGNWLMGIKFILAVALVATAIFLSQQYVLKWLPDLIFTQALVAVALLGAGLLLAYFSYAKSLGPLKLLAALAVAISICPLIYVRGDSHSYNWNNSIEGALDQARTNSQITMVDFYADWCAACKELEVLTFSNPLVQAELEKIALARLDFTNPNDELSEKYNIAGLPCILFLRTDGSEIENSRITGFLSADDFLQHLAQIKNSL